jgi:putative tryptophan/tyrosine transport system substrate-binding protein
MHFHQLKRRELITLLGSVTAWPLAARAQQPERMGRVGVLMSYAPDGQRYISTFLDALAQTGWVRGRNLQIKLRSGGGDHSAIERYAAELVELKPDLILGQTTPSVLALQRATRTIPIVFVNVSEPIGSGFVESLARPSGNITGFSNFEPSMGGKWVELLKEIAPHVARIAHISKPDTSPQGRAYLPSLEGAARSLGVQLLAIPVRDSAEIERAIADVGREPGGGFILPPDVFTANHRELITMLADQYRVPAVYAIREFTHGGGLLSYGLNFEVQFRQAAAYVDRILRGEKPEVLPVQAPTKFELIVNLKAAKVLGLTVPPTLLATADEVIE